MLSGRIGPEGEWGWSGPGKMDMYDYAVSLPPSWALPPSTPQSLQEDMATMGASSRTRRTADLTRPDRTGRPVVTAAIADRRSTGRMAPGLTLLFLVGAKYALPHCKGPAQGSSARAAHPLASAAPLHPVRQSNLFWTSDTPLDPAEVTAPLQPPVN